ncbi:MAG: 4Fe-4S binding protein [Promethearchaeota archaeon]
MICIGCGTCVERCPVF